jgi:hypothetical protein
LKQGVDHPVKPGDDGVGESLAKAPGIIPEALDGDSPHPSRRHCERSEAIHLSQHSSAKKMDCHGRFATSQ